MKRRIAFWIVLLSFFAGPCLCLARQLPYQENNRFASESLLQAGIWMRIAVPMGGVYQLTDDYLRDLGFSDPSRVGVYGFGGYPLAESFAHPHRDDLAQVATYRDEERERTLFYARGLTEWSLGQFDLFEHRTNPYARQAYYFLHQPLGEVERLATTSTSLDQTTPVTSYNAYALHEKEEQSIGQTGRNLYGESFLYSRKQSFELPTPGLLDQSAHVEVNFVASAQQVGATLTLGGDLTSAVSRTIPVIGSDYYQFAKSVILSEKVTPVAAEALNLSLFLDPKGASLTLARLDFIRLNYQARLRQTDFYYTFRHAHAQLERLTYCFEGVSQDTPLQVWDVTDPKAYFQEKLLSQAQGVKFTATEPGLREYVLLHTESVFPTPTFVEQVASQNLHGLPQTDLVIVVQPGLREQAERLAAYRREYDGLHVTLVTPQQVYNEFSSGTPDVTALRLFMKMYYDRSKYLGTPPRYLLLFGDGANDNRGMNASMWKPSVLKNTLLTYQSEYSLNETLSYVCDDYFGFLDDDEGGKTDHYGQLTLQADVLDIGIGRLPVRTLSEARSVVDKILNYSSPKEVGPWKNQLLFLGDDGDRYTHMLHADRMVTLLQDSGHHEFVYHKVYLDAYKREQTASGTAYPTARKQLMDQLNQGTFLLNYSGHGSMNSITHEKLFTLHDAQQMSMKQLPIWVTATCDFSRFDHINTSAGEALLLNPKGGGIALFTTSRVVYSSGNLRLNTHLINNLFTRDGSGYSLRLGDVMRTSKVAMGKDVNKLNFVLLGDPSMRMAYPAHRIRITEINDKPVGEEEIKFSALAKIKVKGEVLTPAGNALATAFNGLIYPTVFDSPDQVASLDQDQTGSPMYFDVQTKRLFSGCDSVRAGEFEFEFVLPKDISYSNKQGMINFYASSDDGAEGQGYFDDFIISGTASQEKVDTLGPEITALWLNHERFKSGDVVNSTPYLIAQLTDESGINTSGVAIGHDLVATITSEDGEQVRYVLNAYFKNDVGTSSRGQLQFSIPTLSAGKYELELTAWDLHNNSSRSTIHFEVKSSVKPTLFSVKTFQNPVSDRAIFLLSHDMPDSQLFVTLEVYNLQGQCVWQEHVQGHSSYMQDLTLMWDLTNFNGTSVPSGIYLYRVSVSFDGVHASTQSQKLIIQK